jgi:hypothetical protein
MLDKPAPLRYPTYSAGLLLSGAICPAPARLHGSLVPYLVVAHHANGDGKKTHVTIGMVTHRLSFDLLPCRGLVWRLRNA